MAVEALLGFAIPVCLARWLIKKYKVRLSTILIGAATFVVFALVLEALVHQIVLKGPYGATTFFRFFFSDVVACHQAVQLDLRLAPGEHDGVEIFVPARFDKDRGF